MNSTYVAKWVSAYPLVFLTLKIFSLKLRHWIFNLVHSVDEIKGLIQAHEQFKATLNEAQKEKENICGLMREAAKIARQVRLFFSQEFQKINFE